MIKLSTSVAIAALAIAGCGGDKTSKGSALPPGTSTAGGGGTVPDDLPPGDEVAPPDDGGVPEDVPPPEPEPPVTFELVNTAEEDLVFSTDKGWQPNIFAFYGQPPKAVSIILYPQFCTASCDLDPVERCPYCEVPDKPKEVLAAEQRQVVAPGETFELAWDGKTHVYEKTRGGERNQRCQCYRIEDPPPETYTVRACGFRISTEVGSVSKMQCVDSTLTLPVEEPTRVRIEFPKPTPPKKGRKR